MSIFVTSFVPLVLSASVTFANPVQDCNQMRDHDRRIRGCTAYIESAKTDPHNLATAHLNRGISYAQRGAHAKALADFETAVQLDPSNALVPYNIGNVFFDGRQYEKAVQAYTRAVALDESFALAHFSRGAARERLGEMPGAEEDFRRALELDPSSEPARRGLQRVRTPKANAAVGERGTVP